jgi:putative ABC transport system permease protein
MLKSYLKIAVRGLIKHKLYAIINIFGLAIGLACCLIVLGHISYEFSFEDFHKNKDRIYRLNSRYVSPDEDMYSAQVQSPLGEVLTDEIPEIEKVAIFRQLGAVNLQIGEKSFISENELDWAGYKHGGNVICANPDYLSVFTFPLLVGNPKTALDEPYSVLISENAAREFFHGENPMGQIIKLNQNMPCQVTGILKNIPENTQMYCDLIVSRATLESMGEVNNDWTDLRGDYVYVLLKKGADPNAVAQKIPAVLKPHLEPEEAKKYSYDLQALDKIYFAAIGSGRHGELTPLGEASMLYMIGFIAGFILLLAIANFVNLATARSAERTKEVGVRKVFGAYRSHLIKQFLGESMLITSISVVIGLAIYEVFKGLIRPMLPREALADFYSNPMMLISLIALILVVGLMAGFYPALYLSRFRPIAVLQNKSGIKSTRSWLRKGLVVFQFTIAIAFICCTAILFNQMHFITGIDPGFDTTNMLLLDFKGETAAADCSLMKSEIVNHNRILSITASSSPPGRKGYSFYGFFPDENRRDEDRIVVKRFMTDYDFISTFGLKLIEGRNFSESVPSDKNHAIIMNESAAKELHISSPIGHRFYGRGDNYYEVIGVVRDFQATPMDYAYQSKAFIMLDPDKCKTLCIKLPSDSISQSLAAIENTWNDALPERQFRYSFLDDEIAGNFDEIKSQIRFFLIFSVLTITIACFGIFGLVAFTAGQRTKEIGIRKVLGASIINIVKMLSKEFIVLIVISNIIAWPFAFWAMSDFLAEFPFRVKIGFGTFIITGSIALILALFSAGYQAVKAARANPIEAIQYE